MEQITLEVVEVDTVKPAQDLYMEVMVDLA
jgi:hypothetical protein